jgi:hypothetical protein
MWPFKSKPESPEEKAALEKLDEETREVAWDEEEKEEDREVSTGSIFRRRPVGRYGRFRPFRPVKGDPLREPVDDEDPVDEHGLRDALHEGEQEYEEKHPGEKS